VTIARANTYAQASAPRSRANTYAEASTQNVASPNFYNQLWSIGNEHSTAQTQVPQTQVPGNDRIFSKRLWSIGEPAQQVSQHSTASRASQLTGNGATASRASQHPRGIRIGNMLTIYESKREGLNDTNSLNHK
jgi:hypothetical protein